MASDVAREPSIERRLTLAVSPSGRLRLLENPDAPSLDPRPAEAIAAAFAERTGRRTLPPRRRRGLHPASAGAGILPGLRAALRRPALRHRRPRGAARPGRGPGPAGRARPARRRSAPAGRSRVRRCGPAPGVVGGARGVLPRGDPPPPGQRPVLPAGQEPASGTSSGASTSTWRRTRPIRDHPFAFLATYTTRLSGQARPQHQPLGQALRTLAGDRSALLSLLAPVDRAADREPPAEGPGGHGRRLRAAGLDAARGPPLPPGRAGVRGGRRHRPGARLVEARIGPGGSRSASPSAASRRPPWGWTRSSTSRSP